MRVGNLALLLTSGLIATACSAPAGAPAAIPLTPAPASTEVAAPPSTVEPSPVGAATAAAATVQSSPVADAPPPPPKTAATAGFEVPKAIADARRYIETDTVPPLQARPIIDHPEDATDATEVGKPAVIMFHVFDGW